MFRDDENFELGKVLAKKTFETNASHCVESSQRFMSHIEEMGQSQDSSRM